MIIVSPSESFPVPCVLCPECSSPLSAVVDEWETEGGAPTLAGVLVSCPLGEDGDHRHTGDLWIGPAHQAAVWAVQHVRVCEVAAEMGVMP